MSTGAYLERCFFDPVAECLTDEVARRLVAIRPDAATLTKVQAFAEKANQGTITPDEDTEYKDFIEACDLLATLQAKARQRLAM